MGNRVDKRGNLDLRPVTIERGFMKFAEGSCLISMGDTRVICTATVEERVPMWMIRCSRAPARSATSAKR